MLSFETVFSGKVRSFKTVYSRKVSSFELNSPRTLPARLASCSCLVYDLSWGEKNHCFFTPSPRILHHGISTGLLWLIDFEVVFKSFTVQRHFFVMRHISCTNAICMFNWSRNYVFKVNKLHFFTHRMGAKKICVSTTSYWAPHWHCLFWPAFKPVSVFPVYLNLVAPLQLSFIFSSEPIIGFSFN